MMLAVECAWQHHHLSMAGPYTPPYPEQTAGAEAPPTHWVLSTWLLTHVTKTTATPHTTRACCEQYSTVPVTRWLI